MTENIQISLTIQAAQAGGLAVFEYSHDTPSVLVFSGNLNETTEYLNARMAGIIQPVEAVPTTVPQPVARPAAFRKIGTARTLADNLAEVDHA